MLDFSVYIGPLIVAVVMLISLLAFGIWGSRSIRESAEDVLAARSAAAAVADDPAPVVGDENAEEYDLNLLPGTEHSGETSDQLDDSQVYGGFAQSFVEGEEVSASMQTDYSEAISRIKADLDAEATRYEDEVAVSAEKAAVGQAVPGAMADEDAAEVISVEGSAEDKAEDAEVPAKEVGDKDTTRFFSAGESAALRSADDLEADTDAAAIAAVAEAAAAMEETRVMRDLEPQTEKKNSAVLEETLLITSAPQSAKSTVPGMFTPAENTAGAQNDSLMPESPLPFGGKIAWLAVPGYKPSEVIAALRLAEVEPANWTAGLTQAYSTEDKVFVSPVLDGWVLVIGKTLWRKADMNRSAENIGWLKDIGRIFGNACFFSSMKGLGNHGWVGIRDGEIVRAYGYSGELQELIWLVGEPTEEEVAINPGFAAEMQERREGDFRPIVPDEKMVLELAASWSIDPTFAGKQYPMDFGFLGRVE